MADFEVRTVRKSTSRNRWWITGILETEEPLHIGTGEQAPVPGLKADDGKDLKVNLVAEDATGCAYIPGSALKGCLRTFYTSRLTDRTSKDRLDELFGSADAAAEKSVGAKLVFHDSHCISPAPDPEPKLTCWNGDKRTAIATGVSIDRRSGTAAKHKLFNLEYVPPETQFLLTVSGSDLEEDEISLLLSLLKTASTAGLRIGAGSPDSYGKVKWTPQKVLAVDGRQINEWLKANAWYDGEPGDAAATGIKPVHAYAKEQQVAEKALAISTPAYFKISLALEFDGGFLVNSPHDAARTQGTQNPINHTPVRDNRGRTILPSSAFRGSLRSQAEKIARTIGKGACEGGTGETCAVKDSIAGSKQCAVCSLFGSPGWKSPVRVSRFTATEAIQPVKQEFVAIDRFTSGTAKGKKFNAERVIGPRLDGTITLDVERLLKTGSGISGLGLAALVIRDLVEGDITFGFGAAKGYGSLKKATITAIESTVSWGKDGQPGIELCPVSTDDRPEIGKWLARTMPAIQKCIDNLNEGGR